MERSSKRGKIPQSDWPLIMSRYEAGETLASIARTYDCSPPAISYVVSRSRARHPGGDAVQKPAPGSEPQLIKAPSGETTAAAAAPAGAFGGANSGIEPRTNGHSAPEPHPPAIRPEPPPLHANGRRDENPVRNGNGFVRNGAGERDGHWRDAMPRSAMPAERQQHAGSPAAANGDQRRTLHLSLGGATPGNGASHPAEAASGEAAFGERRPAAEPTPTEPHHGGGAAGVTGFSETRATGSDSFRRNDGDAARKEAASFIDKELRARVDGDIAVFLAAFDAALLQDSQENRSALREATDRLLRAGARTRIELERLEARMPLNTRDSGGRGEADWRR